MSDNEPPEDLRETGRRLWVETLGKYGLGHHELVLLHEACRTADRLERLAVEGRDAPLTAVDRKGDPIASPLLVEARQQQIVFARLVASLRLPDLEDVGARPQRRGGARGVYGTGEPAHVPDRWRPRTG
ncbi:hypothetical protein [Pseudonocardia sp. MH-G8]|uniref:hypothetical protein n=1 Tax=Pseudonocardia sp. MH-G8 TaxID=1854588 RepID=UPI000BA074E0|nr:hypothetical protein [Pseudonocardia sp. MH-G8]OZM81146.1 hypothetical protein CFP66_17350 [Pseudonocardia sp. MH-G8]